MSESLPATLCLDGNAIRRIREEKKLTQLYVANVVGVTTDTVSRWENNRYPSTKRENVLRLAEALEVPAYEILRDEGADADFPLESEGKKSLPLRGALAICILVIIGAAAGFLFRSRELPSSQITAERFLPPYAAPGAVLPVRVRLEVEGEGKGFILREHFPPGWKLVESSPPASSLDNEEGTARWIVRSVKSPQTISYLLKVAPAAILDSNGGFQGDVVASTDGRRSPVPVGGAGQVRVGRFLWPDQDADLVIDDSEMLQASNIFDEMQGVHMDYKALETIWDAGGYRWEPQQQTFLPSRPDPR